MQELLPCQQGQPGTTVWVLLRLPVPEPSTLESLPPAVLLGRSVQRSAGHIWVSVRSSHGGEHGDDVPVSKTHHSGEPAPGSLARTVCLKE